MGLRGMIGKILLASALLAVTVGAGLTAEFVNRVPLTPAIIPPRIRKSFDAATKIRKEADDGKVTFARDTVRTVDLTGERQDFIVSLEDAKCSPSRSSAAPAAASWTSTWHCPTAPTARLLQCMRGYKILPAKPKSARTIRFDLHGGYCNTYGAAEC